MITDTQLKLLGIVIEEDPDSRWHDSFFYAEEDLGITREEIQKMTTRNLVRLIYDHGVKTTQRRIRTALGIVDQASDEDDYF